MRLDTPLHISRDTKRNSEKISKVSPEFNQLTFYIHELEAALLPRQESFASLAHTNPTRQF